MTKVKAGGRAFCQVVAVQSKMDIEYEAVVSIFPFFTLRICSKADSPTAHATFRKRRRLLVSRIRPLQGEHGY